MAIDPNGNKGVSRAPMPTHGFECIVCHDTGLYVWQGEYRVCMGPHTEGRRHQLQDEATEANKILRKLEERTTRK